METLSVLSPTDSIYTERYMGTPDANEAGYYVRKTLGQRVPVKSLHRYNISNAIH